MKLNIKLYILFLATVMLSGGAYSQQKKEKLAKTFSVTNDVEIDIDTRYVDVIFDTWNKNEVLVEAYIEGDATSESIKDWNLDISGNKDRLRISSKDGYNNAKVYDIADLGDININIDLAEIIGQSLTVVEPIMNGIVGPLLEGISGTPLPEDFYEEMSRMKFDHEAYKKEGRAYLERWERKMNKSFGPEFEEKMEKWEKEVERKSEIWSEQLINTSGIPRWPFNSGGNITFDSDAYEEDKQAYVAKLNRKYNSKVTVRQVDKWLDDVEEWGEDFGEKMEDWGDNFGKSMEKWGESFGKNIEKSMEKWGENFGKDMEKWGESFGKSMEKWAKEQEANWEENHSEDEHGNKHKSFSMTWDSEDDKISNKDKRNIKRVIKIKMPKKAQLDLNVRYGKVNIEEANDVTANISHGNLMAKNINGDSNSFDVSYSPIVINSWSGGSLKTSQVKDCRIMQAKDISINSNSSNVTINNLNGSGMISGSFGKLSIPKISDDFGSLTIILENSELALKLPQDAFNFSYSGDHNDFILPNKLETKSMKNGKTEMINGFHKTRSTGNLITISAKYSDVVLQ